MRRRFGRRGRSSSDSKRPALNVERELARLIDAGLVPARSLEPVREAEIAADFAAVGIGASPDGRALLVSVAPQSGADAWLAALAAADAAAEQGFAGEVWAVSPKWSLAARRRLALGEPESFPVRAIQEPGEGEIGTPVQPEPTEASACLAESQLAAGLSRAAEREVFLRALSVLRGLAHKHGGQVRMQSAGVELVLLARTIATLRTEGDAVLLDMVVPRRARRDLSGNGLAEAFDHLEGSIRKYLNEKKVREGEEGFRGRLLGILAGLAGAPDPIRWPLGGADPDPIDFLGIDGEGRPVIGAVRKELDLEQLGPILDGLIAMEPRLPAWVGTRRERVRFERPRLVLAAEQLRTVVERVLSRLALEASLFDVEVRRGEPMLVARERRLPLRVAPGSMVTETGTVERAPEREEAQPSDAPDAAAERPPSRFEEVSVFDLGEESSGDAGGNGGRGGRRRRRRRSRGRGRPASSSETEASSRSENGEGVGEPAAEERRPARATATGRPHRTRRPEEVDTEGSETAEPAEAVASFAVEEDSEEVLVGLVRPVSDFVEDTEPHYDDEEEVDEERDPELDRLHLERESRRRARLAKLEAEPEPVRRPPRRRAALVALADRDAATAAVVLAREVRLVEGIWVYPQSELMTFFRSVATDLGEETPIYLVGFTASPAREILQAAGLYRERLFWFDHHAWPPEDLEGLREAIGEDAVFVEPDVGSSLPVVLGFCNRRSRFSDKLVDLLRGRFTQHDYERWGRLWWWRLGEVASRPGDRRADLSPLLSGRPSDLAREAAQADVPSSPPEVEFVAGRDFRLVHFGGYALVRVPVPGRLDVHLCARIARERYGALLSVAWREDEDRVVLAADDVTTRPAFDLSGMVDHLAGKFTWVEGLTDADHVARFRVADLASRPDRLDEVVAEIAMGRSILEG